jgi:Lipoprotein amino terminal region
VGHGWQFDDPEQTSRIVERSGMTKFYAHGLCLGFSSFLLFQIELDPGYHPAEPAVNVLMEQFHVKIQNETVQKIFFHKDELPWSKNIKRSIASLLILHGSGVGAFVDENDRGLYGKCKSEYFVVNNEGNLLITKNYNMDDCTPFFGYVRSNLPHNFCQQEKQTQVITSRIATYNIEKIESKNKYLLKEIDSTMRTNVQTFESYYPQFLFSQIVIKYVSHKPLESKNDTVNIEQNEDYEECGLSFVSPEEATGGRKNQTPEQLVKKTADLLDQLADSLEAAKLDFNEPYDGKVSEIIRIMEPMDLNALKMLFAEIDIGTSYRQETSRNLFLEIIPRAGTAATVLFTRDLVINKQVRSTIAVQLLMALPFYIAEPTQELIKECEGFLYLGPERPDVKHVAVLGYATMIYKTFVVGKMPLDVFEKYVKMYFDLFLSKQCL